MNDIKTRHKTISDEFSFFGTRYENAALLNIATKAKNLVIAIEIEMKKRGIISSVTNTLLAENMKIVAQTNIIDSVKYCQYCGSPMRGRRADAKFCTKNCNNKSRYINEKNSPLDA